MQSHVKAARFFTDILENKFNILGFKFGLDPIIGLVPILGDVVGFILSAYIVWIAHQAHIPAGEIAKMWRNIIFDLLLGTVPFIGDVSDFFYKAGSKNLVILERNIKDRVIDAEVVV